MNKLQNFNCLVCNNLMKRKYNITYIDHSCHIWTDHHFSWRIVNDNISKLRIRFSDDNERLCLKVHYDEGYSEVWTSSNSTRLKINQIIVTNFEDIEKLKNKIRTILVFY